MLPVLGAQIINKGRRIRLVKRQYSSQTISEFFKTLMLYQTLLINHVVCKYRYLWPFKRNDMAFAIEGCSRLLRGQILLDAFSLNFYFIPNGKLITSIWSFISPMSCFSILVARFPDAPSPKHTVYMPAHCLAYCHSHFLKLYYQNL